MMDHNPMPVRRKLPHAVPAWVPQGVRHFVTINCKKMHVASLTKAGVADALLESGLFYEKAEKWYLWIMLVMPDHIHFIATFNLEKSLKTTVSSWKRFQSRNLGVVWQSDFFEHRLRNDDEYFEKVAYVRMNPVRRGLVANFYEWPYVYDRTKGGQRDVSNRAEEVEKNGSIGTSRPTGKAEFKG